VVVVVEVVGRWSREVFAMCCVGKGWEGWENRKGTGSAYEGRRVRGR